MDRQEVFLDKYPLQKDMRIRLPKQIIENMHIKSGVEFNIYYCPNENEIVLKLASKKTDID